MRFSSLLRLSTSPARWYWDLTLVISLTAMRSQDQSWGTHLIFHRREASLASSRITEVLPLVRKEHSTSASPKCSGGVTGSTLWLGSGVGEGVGQDAMQISPSHGSGSHILSTRPWSSHYRTAWLELSYFFEMQQLQQISLKLSINCVALPAQVMGAQRKLPSLTERGFSDS